VVEAPGLGVEVGHEVSETGSPGELTDHESEELVPSPNRAELPALVVPQGGGFKFMSREDSQDLGEHGRMVGQGLVPPLLSMVWVAPPL
jgi:hypothetical protein